MLCACSGEKFKLEGTAPQSPESLATRDFSASGLSRRTTQSPESFLTRYSVSGFSSRTDDRESRLEKAQVDEAESTLKEALSLNYEEARALLGRLEYQRGNFDAALQVFQGIDIRGLIPKMTKSIMEHTRQQKPRSKTESIPTGLMSMHSVSLLLEAILLKAKSLQELGHIIDAAKECKFILDIVESALPNGMPENFSEDCKLQEMFHKALELVPKLWTEAGILDEAMMAYRRALVKPWNLDPHSLVIVQKELAAMLLYSGCETRLPSHLQAWAPTTLTNMEEGILLLCILMKKMVSGEIDWDPEIMDHLTYALSITGSCDSLAVFLEEALPGIYSRAERWYLLALCYSASGQDEAALNLLRKISGSSEEKHKRHHPSLLLGAKLSSQNSRYVQQGVDFARKAIGRGNHLDKHFMDQAHKFLGICYGTASRVSVLDSERTIFQRVSLDALSNAALLGKDDPEILFSTALENATQRNLDIAFGNAMMYNDMVGGSLSKGWRLLALVVSAQQRFRDAEVILDLAFDEAGSMDQLEFLRLKAVIQIAGEQPKEAIETFQSLLGLIQTRKELHLKSFNHEVQAKRNLEMETWQDLAGIYTKLGSWSDAKVCADKALSIEFYSPRSWHITGTMLEKQSLYKEALVSFNISLSIEPDYVPSIVSTAQVLMKFSDDTLPIVRSLLMNALRLEPTNHEAWLNLGLVSKKEGSFQRAADYFQAAYELKVSSPVKSFV